MNLLFSAAQMAAKSLYDSQTLELRTTCGADDQFSGPKQIRWSGALGKLLVSAGTNSIGVRSADLSFYTKFYHLGSPVAIGSDASNIYSGTNALQKSSPAYSSISTCSIPSMRMIDASGDPDYIYVTSNNTTDGHGVRKVRKSDMTVVASLLATGAGDGQFNNPLGVFYYSPFIFVADVSNNRIVKLNASDLSFAANISPGYGPRDLCTDGVNWYVHSSTTLYKYDMSFTDATKSSKAFDAYSICIIPNQGDGNGQTLAITDNANSHLARYKCSDLSQVGADVGSSGTGADTLCDPQVTGPAGIWYDSEGGNYAVASAANISKNGFSGDFFKQTPNVMRYRSNTGLAAITAIDFNDDKISGEVKNLYKCINLTSCKLQTNLALVLDLGRLSYKLQTIWAYACGSGITGSIRHMTAATSINLKENGASQAQVDQWIDDLWQNRDAMTPGSANFNGSNAAPSGTYQDATPPTTGKEKAYDLVENYGWSLAITS